MKDVYSMFGKFGDLNFKKMIKDKLVKMSNHKKRNVEILPVSEHINTDKKGIKIIQYGQHDKKNRLHGVGRKILINRKGGGLVWEGQFHKGKLHNFARLMSCSANQEYECYIGRWVNSMHHGFGMKVTDDGKETNGLWEEALYGNPPRRIDLIKSFNPYTSHIAKEIDFSKYG
jgi:hypothetical protein